MTATIQGEAGFSNGTSIQGTGGSPMVHKVRLAQGNALDEALQEVQSHDISFSEALRGAECCRALRMMVSPIQGY
jgi:hypothetical protein